MTKAKRSSSLGKAKQAAIDELIVGFEVAQIAEKVMAKSGIKESYLKHMRKHCRQEMKAYDYFIARIPEIRKEMKDGLKERGFFEDEK